MAVLLPVARPAICRVEGSDGSVNEDIPAGRIGNNPGDWVVQAENERTHEVGGWIVAAPRRSAATLASAEPRSDARDNESLPFADVIDAHLDRLYGFCVHLAGDPTDAEDLVQETLLRALRAYSGLRAPDHARGWLFAIATNVWRDQLRAQGRRVRTTPLEDLDEDTDEFSLFQTIAIEDPFPYSDELHLDFLRLFGDEDVQAVFGAISPRYRLPIILTVVHGFSCKEAAAVLDIPIGTLLSRLHRGRKQLERGLWDYAVERGLVNVSEER
jgi:RNA polymerase sigma-70 factor (ECF subfamily)